MKSGLSIFKTGAKISGPQGLFPELGMVALVPCLGLVCWALAQCLWQGTVPLNSEETFVSRQTCNLSGLSFPIVQWG